MQKYLKYIHECVNTNIYILFGCNLFVINRLKKLNNARSNLSLISFIKIITVSITINDVSYCKYG